MPKICQHSECKYNVFGGGFCKMHQYKRTDKKTKALTRTPIKEVSSKTAKLKAEYLKERTKFLDGKICPITGRPATEIHHIDGREYERLIDKTKWLGVTREGHKKIHANPIWAREKGYLI